MVALRLSRNIFDNLVGPMIGVSKLLIGPWCNVVVADLPRPC
jgi:hypothetical protein